MTIAATKPADFYTLASDNSKRFALEAFSFTHQYGLNIYFDDLDDLREITKDVEFEFWQLHDTVEDAEYKVDDFKTLRHVMDFIDEGTDPDLIDIYMEIVDGGYSSWEEVERWYDNYVFCDAMDNDYEFGYHLIHEVDCLEMPDHLTGYIDYEAYGRDAMTNGYLKIGNKIFLNC